MWYDLSTVVFIYAQEVRAMTIAMAKTVYKISKLFLVISIIGLMLFIAAYWQGKADFKFMSLPIMACVISITWFFMSKAAIMTMTENENKK